MPANRSTRDRSQRAQAAPPTAPASPRSAGVASRRRKRTGRAAGEPAAPETLTRRLARLEARRRELRCSQAQLAHLLGVSASSVSRLFGPDERKRPRDLISPEGMRRIELALRLLSQAAPNARSAQPATHAWSGRTLAPHPQTARSQGVSRPAQPPLLSDSGVYLIPSARMRARGPATYRLLLAEDDADTVGLYQMVFADGDDMTRYEVTVARTAEECVERLRAASRFDLLVMDLGIAEPREGATEPALLPWLRSHPELRPPRILVVSGVSPYQLQTRLLDLRALDATFLAKPFDVEEMLATARALCEGSAPRDESARPTPATV